MNEDELNTDSLKKFSGKADELKVPENYFESMQERIANRIDGEEADDSFFISQQESLLFKAQTVALKEHNEWNVPVDYFEKSEEAILQNTIKENQIKVFSLRKMVVGVAAAASVVSAVLFLLPDKQVQPSSISFDQMLAEATLDENDFLSTLSNEEMNSLFAEQIETVNIEAVTSGMMEDVIVEEITTTADVKNDAVIKPSANDQALTLDSLSEEEIMQYLLDEESDLLGN